MSLFLADFQMLDTNFINEILEISGSHQSKRSFVIVCPTAVPDQLQRP